MESTSEAVVGLEYITEYHSGNPSDDPLYHCGLEACEDAQGDAEFMRDHILSNRHRQSFLEIKTGSFLKHQTEIQQVRSSSLTFKMRNDGFDICIQIFVGCSRVHQGLQERLSRDEGGD